MKTRVVLDTNIIISACFGGINSPNMETINKWENNEFDLLVSQDTVYEYIKKLKFKNVPKEYIETLLTNIYKSAIHIEIEFFHLHIYPKDPDDIAFVLCAKNGKADYLISYDDHLLELNGIYDFKICLPLDFLSEFRDLMEH